MNQTSNSETALPSSQQPWRVGTLVYSRRDLVVLFFWLLLGGFAWSCKDRCTPPIVQLLLSKFGASDNFSSLLIGSLPYAMAIFVLPVVGYFSDRCRSTHGRRLPFLTRAIPIIAISMPGLTLSPWLGGLLDQMLGSSSPGFESSVLIYLALFWGLFQFAGIIGNLLLGALFNDVVPQAVIGRFFAGFRAVGLVAGMLFNFYLFDGSDTTYVAIFGGFGVLAVFAFSLMCLKVKEGDYPSPPTSPTAPESSNATVRYLRECFGSSYYWIAYIAIALCMVTWGPVNYYSTLFTKETMAADLYGKLLALTFAISFVLAYPLGLLADRFHPLRIGIVTLMLYGLVTLWGGFFAQSPTNFDIAFVLHGVCSGACMTGTASLTQRLFPRLKYAQFASAASIIACVFNILLTPVTGYILGDAHPDYTRLFLISSAMAWSGVVALVVLYRAFRARGGDLSHAAPDSEAF